MAQSRTPGISFRIGPVPITIGWSFIAIIVMFGFSAGSVSRGLWWFAIVTVSVLVHEGGHVLALASFGHAARIELMWLGGLTISAGNKPLSPWRSIVVSLAGPVAGMLLGLGIWLGTDTPVTAEGRFIFQMIRFVTIWWNLFNLLPIMPLDGGHVMRELFTMMSAKSGTAIAAWVSIVFAAIAGFLAIHFNIAGAWGVMLAVIAVSTNLRYVAVTPRQRARVTAQDLHERLAYGDLSATDELMSIVNDPASSEVVSPNALTTLGWSLLTLERFDDLARLDQQRLHQTHRTYFQAALAWRAGDMNTANALTAHALATASFEPPAIFFARTFRRLGELERLHAWIDQLPRDQAIAIREKIARIMADHEAIAANPWF